MVEHTAHNGFVVGSIPTKLKLQISMKLNFKTHKMQKYKLYLLTEPLFFIYSSKNQKFDKWIDQEQEFKNLDLTYLKISNNLLAVLLVKTILKNFKSINLGLIIFIKFNFFLKKKVKNIKMFSSFNLLCMKLNNKIYTVYEFDFIKTLNYKGSINIFYKKLKYFSQFFNKICFIFYNKKYRNNVI